MDSRNDSLIKAACTCGMSEDVNGKFYQLYDPDRLISEARKTVGDLPLSNYLSKNSKLCGYISPTGEYYNCKSCEHQWFVRKLLWENEKLRNAYFSIPASFFDQLPRGMLQEEYFLMKQLGWIKISSFVETPLQMVVFFYKPLTSEQSKIVYPL